MRFNEISELISEEFFASHVPVCLPDSDRTNNPLIREPDAPLKYSHGYAKEAVENFLSSFKDVTKPYTFEVKFI